MVVLSGGAARAGPSCSELQARLGLAPLTTRDCWHTCLVGQPMRDPHYQRHFTATVPAAKS